MSKTRIKVQTGPDIGSRAEAEATMGALASAENKRRQHIVDRDTIIESIKEDWTSKIEAAELLIKLHTDRLRERSSINPREFGKAKSIVMQSGTLGFRTGTPKLVLLRGWNWKKAADAVMQWLPNFIRNTPEVDKESIIAQRDELAPHLTRCGIKVDQGESFFIEPKLTDLDARQTVKA